ncbi:CPBP family intramembrane metalloprotease [Leuconostoc falkenbergense]|nr:CPBP family intramembrane metalloprotease [Leuconostoc falkenbergense]
MNMLLKQVKRIGEYTIVAIFVFLYLFAVQVPVIITLDNSSSYILKFLQYTIIYIIAFSILSVIMAKVFKFNKQVELNKILKNTPKYFLIGVLYVLIIIVFYILTTKPSLLTHITSLHINIQTSHIYKLMGVKESSNSVYIALLDSTVVGPIMEELLFRRCLISYGIKLKFNIIFIVIVTALLFNLMHGGSLQVSRMLLGLINGVLYVKTRSVYPGAIVHVIGNIGIIGLNLVQITGS